MTASEYILALPIEQRKEILEIFLQKFQENLKRKNEAESEFYAYCCKVTARYINE